MGLFETISRRVRQRRERRDAVKRFRSYVDPALVEHVLSNPPAEMPPPETREIEFVLAIVDDRNLGRLPELLCAAVDVLKAGGALVDSMSGSLVLGTFGLFPLRDGRSAREHRMELARRLHERLGENAAIVHGTGPAAVGNFGSAESGHWHYGCSMERFSTVIRLLASLRRGEVREWTSGAATAE